jgi:hypothetical protein
VGIKVGTELSSWARQSGVDGAVVRCATRRASAQNSPKTPHGLQPAGKPLARRVIAEKTSLPEACDQRFALVIVKLDGCHEQCTEGKPSP